VQYTDNYKYREEEDDEEEEEEWKRRGSGGIGARGRVGGRRREVEGNEKKGWRRGNRCERGEGRRGSRGIGG